MNKLILAALLTACGTNTITYDIDSKCDANRIQTIKVAAQTWNELGREHGLLHDVLSVGDVKAQPLRDLPWIPVETRYVTCSEDSHPDVFMTISRAVGLYFKTSGNIVIFKHDMVYGIAVHEFGHALGLHDLDCSETGQIALMCGANDLKGNLTEVDQKNFCDIYDCRPSPSVITD